MPLAASLPSHHQPARAASAASSAAGFTAGTAAGAAAVTAASAAAGAITSASAGAVANAAAGATASAAAGAVAAAAEVPEALDPLIGMSAKPPPAMEASALLEQALSGLREVTAALEEELKRLTAFHATSSPTCSPTFAGDEGGSKEADKLTSSSAASSASPFPANLEERLAKTVQQAVDSAMQAFVDRLMARPPPSPQGVRRQSARTPSSASPTSSTNSVSLLSSITPRSPMAPPLQLPIFPRPPSSAGVTGQGPLCHVNSINSILSGAASPSTSEIGRRSTLDVFDMDRTQNQAIFTQHGLMGLQMQRSVSEKTISPNATYENLVTGQVEGPQGSDQLPGTVSSGTPSGSRPGNFFMNEEGSEDSPFRDSSSAPSGTSRHTGSASERSWSGALVNPEVEAPTSAPTGSTVAVVAAVATVATGHTVGHVSFRTALEDSSEEHGMNRVVSRIRSDASSWTWRGRAQRVAELVGFPVSPVRSLEFSPAVSSRSSVARVCLDNLRAEQDVRLMAMLPSMSRTPSGFRLEEKPSGRLEAVREAIMMAPQFLLCFWGVLPVGEPGACTRRYRRLVQLLALGLFAGCVAVASMQTELVYMHLATASYALGGFLGLMHLSSQRVEELLGPDKRPLPNHATNIGFWEGWQSASASMCGVTIGMWVIMVLARAGLLLQTGCFSIIEASARDVAVLLGLLAPAAGLFAVLIFLHLHVCTGLELAIDHFCLSILQHKDFARSITEWNLVQALLRHSAQTVGCCFLFQATSVMACLLLIGLEVLQAQNSHDSLASELTCAALRCGPVLPPVLMLTYSLFRAASLTEKCTRVPSLVNSWAAAEHPIDHDRLFVVQHMVHSEAGFYVYGIRLGASVALKFAYFLLLAAFTFFSRFIIVR